MKKIHMSYEKKKGLYGYGFIALWFIGALVFFIIPVIRCIKFAFEEVTPTDGALQEIWVGLDKFNYAFNSDPNYRQYLIECLKDTLLQTPVIIIFSLFVAIVINQKFRGRTFARAVFFLPVIIATGPVYEIITGNMATNGTSDAAQFTTMFETDMVDQLLEFIGIYGFNDKFTELLTTITGDILNLVWKCGIQILIFLAALQGVSTSAKEAATMEGATAWEFFWKITLPCISPMILTNLVYTIVDTFTDPTNKVMTLIVSKQTQWDYGLMAAMAWAYFGIVIIALAIVYLIIKNWIYYEVE